MRHARGSLRGVALGGAAILVTAVLAGCGGGGGGSAVVYKGSETPATITAGNAQDLTTAVVTAEGLDFPAVASFTKPGGEASPMTGDLLHRFGFVHRQIQALGKSGDVARMSLKFTQPCPDGGSVTLEAPSLTAETGLFKGTYNQCDLGDGFLINGTVSETITISNTTAQVGSVHMSLSMSFGGASFRFAGDVTFDSDLVAFTDTTMGDYEYWDSVAAEGMRLADMTMTETFADAFNQDAGCPITRDYTMTVYDAVFGSVTMATTAPVVYTTDACINPNPSSGGPIVVTGLGDATVTLTPVSTTQVDFDVDTDGDTVPEISTTLNWTDLEP